MANLRFRRVPENDLVDLQDVDLRLLDMALCDLKDKIQREAAKGNATLEPYARQSLDHLHDLVLKIKKGEEIVDE